MKATGIIRNIDPLGRIVVPKEIRNQLEIQEGDPLEIFVDGENIIIKKHHTTCIFCGSDSALSVFKEKPVCSECLSEISNRTDKA